MHEQLHSEGVASNDVWLNDGRLSRGQRSATRTREGMTMKAPVLGNSDQIWAGATCGGAGRATRRQYLEGSCSAAAREHGAHRSHPIVIGTARVRLTPGLLVRIRS